MDRRKKYGILVVSICILTIFNLWNIIDKQNKNTIDKIIEKYETRISSLEESNTIFERERYNFSGFNVINNEYQDGLIKKSTLLILLSEFKCNKCQENELLKLENFYAKYSDKVNVIGATTKKMKNHVGVQARNLKINFPIYYTDDSTFTNSLSFSTNYPQLLFVKDNIVVSGFVPISKDNEFSETFYQSLTNKLD